MPLSPSFIYWPQSLLCLLDTVVGVCWMSLQTMPLPWALSTRTACDVFDCSCESTTPTVSEHGGGATAVSTVSLVGECKSFCVRRLVFLPAQTQAWRSALCHGPGPQPVHPPSHKSWSWADEEEYVSAQHHSDCSRNWQEAENLICEETECPFQSIQQIFISLPYVPELF